MAKYFVDTSVLTEALLKFGPTATACRAKLTSNETQLPGFAVREFKAGPLKNWVWLHNRLATTQSLSESLGLIQALSRTPQRSMTSTVLEALKIARESSIGRTMLQTLTAKYGPKASLDAIEADEIRLHLYKTIMRAWRNRRSLTKKSVCDLNCYQEVAPQEKRGLIEIQPMKCYPSGGECSLAGLLRGNMDALIKLRDANQAMPESSESKRRGRVLKDLVKDSRYLLDEHDCRSLGDALFAFFCPPDAEVLTTNLKDHGPLATALGKVAAMP
jgi:hypothetical protein